MTNFIPTKKREMIRNSALLLRTLFKLTIVFVYIQIEDCSTGAQITLELALIMQIVNANVLFNQNNVQFSLMIALFY